MGADELVAADGEERRFVVGGRVEQDGGESWELCGVKRDDAYRHLPSRCARTPGCRSGLL